MEKGNSRSPRLRGQHGFAASRRPQKQPPLGSGAERLELLGVLKELDDLLEFHLRLFHACYVVEGDLGTLSVNRLARARPKERAWLPPIAPAART